MAKQRHRYRCGQEQIVERVQGTSQLQDLLSNYRQCQQPVESLWQKYLMSLLLKSQM
jgi:hypothetical protein